MKMRLALWLLKMIQKDIAKKDIENEFVKKAYVSYKRAVGDCIMFFEADLKK